MEHHNQSTDYRRRLLRKLPKSALIAVAIVAVIVIIIVLIVAAPLLIGLVSAIVSGDFASWLDSASKNLQNIVQPITDFLNSLPGSGG